MVRDEEAWAREGDPHADWQWTKNTGLELEWVRASKLKTKDRILMSNRFAHTVAEVYEVPSGLWRVVFMDPTMAGCDPLTGKPWATASRISSYFPRRREWYVKSDFLFRKILKQEESVTPVSAEEELAIKLSATR